MSVENSLVDPFERLLRACSAPAQVRTIDQGGATNVMWRQLEESGFLDALLPVHAGGAGLALRDVFPLIELSGIYALPLPFAQTMLARAILHAAGESIPHEAIVLAHGKIDPSDGSIRCGQTAQAMTAHWALVGVRNKAILLPLAEARRDPVASFASSALLTWSLGSAKQETIACLSELRVVQACLLAAQMSGAMASVLRMTLTYANERSQFGRAIGKFQAIQHQIAVMAEQTALAHSAARIGSDANGFLPDTRKASIAKAVTSEVAASICAMGHAVHGAIGVTEDFDLQLFTRRLHEWRLCAGSEAYWNHRIGAELLATESQRVLDFIR